MEHEYLFGILKGFGFGRNFIQWIKILYKGAITKIKCNGFLTECFKIRSIRQGCPLSALLHSLVAEPLGLAIKNKEKIRGVGIEESKKVGKTFQYADDTTVIVNGVESVKLVMQEVQKFCKASGGKIIEEKNIFMRFGEVLVLTNDFTFKEVEEICILGILMGKEEKIIMETMWEELMGGIERRLNFWKMRGK